MNELEVETKSSAVEFENEDISWRSRILFLINLFKSFEPIDQRRIKLFNFKPDHYFCYEVCRKDLRIGPIMELGAMFCR